MAMHRVTGAMAAMAVLAGAIGCSSSQTISRGQSPGIRPVDHHESACTDSHGHGHIHGGGHGHVGHCPGDACMVGGGMAGCWHGGHCGPGWGKGRGQWPYKRTYHAPTGLRYPPANVPPTVYQYPYYTLRGPTDFFYE